MSKLTAEIERLEQRVADLERRLASVEPPADVLEPIVEEEEEESFEWVHTDFDLWSFRHDPVRFYGLPRGLTPPPSPWKAWESDRD